jgi:membrane protease YdiL (CAAX protease family)
MLLRDPKLYGPLSILIVSALIVIVDGIFDPFLPYYDQVSKGRIILNNVLFVLPVGLLGLYFASRMGLPWWWRSDESSNRWQVSYIVISLGVLLVTTNTILNLSSPDKVALNPLFSSITLKRAIGLSLHAGLVEETLFRLFLFSFVAWVIDRIFHSRKPALFIGAVVSTFIFALFHTTSAHAVAFVLGFAIVYIYYKNGLLPAMVAHFFADAVPFALLSLSL